MFFLMNIVAFNLVTSSEVDLICLKLSRLRPVRSEFTVPDPRSGEQRTPEMDMFSLTLVLFEIMVDSSPLRRTSESEKLGKLAVKFYERVNIPCFVVEFVPVFIESKSSEDPRKKPSFDNISESLRENYFTIADGIDSNGGSAFVSLTNQQKSESSEELDQNAFGRFVNYARSSLDVTLVPQSQQSRRDTIAV
jgi:hypothetical protein